MNNPLSDLIYAGESGRAKYDAYNRGTDAHNHMRPLGEKVAVSQLTIKEIQDRQALPGTDPNHLGAVGAYQVMKGTLRDAVRHLNLDVHQKLSPTVQEHIFADHLITQKRPEVTAYITGAPGATLRDAQTGLAQEWASLGDPSRKGGTHYSSPNHASISPNRVEVALNQMRDTYQAELRKHASPAQAWKAATATDGLQTPVLHAPAAAHHVDHAATRKLWIASTAPAAAKTLRNGDHGHAVSQLQTELNQHGHKLHVDGQFGAATEQAVTHFQREHKLTVDGVVGIHTRHALALDAVRAQTQAQRQVPQLNRAGQHHP